MFKLIYALVCLCAAAVFGFASVAPYATLAEPWMEPTMRWLFLGLAGTHAVLALVLVALAVGESDPTMPC